MLSDHQLRWIRRAMNTDFESSMTQAKVYRIIGQIFEQAARKIEQDLVDKVENRLYNTKTETQGATNA